MASLDASLVERIAAERGKGVQYIREQISRRARRHKVLSDVELAIWCDELDIPVGNYLKKLSPETRNQFREYFYPRNANDVLKIGNLKITAQREKKPQHLYELWWVQVFGIGLLAATISGILSQLVGAVLTNFFGITKP